MPLSTDGLRAVYEQETEKEFVTLIQIDHDTFDAPLRVCDHKDDLEHSACSSDGATKLFRFAPFEVNLPTSPEDETVKSVISITNVDRRVIEAVRRAVSTVDVTLHVVLSDDEDAVEAGPWVFQLREVTYDAITVSGTLMYEDWLNEPSPAYNFTPDIFPALFKG